MAQKRTKTPLTAREVEVVRLLMQGKPNKQIAEELHISVNTVEFHVSNVLRKLGVKSRMEAALWGRERGLKP